MAMVGHGDLTQKKYMEIVPWFGRIWEKSNAGYSKAGCQTGVYYSHLIDDLIRYNIIILSTTWVCRKMLGNLQYTPFVGQAHLHSSWVKIVKSPRLLVKHLGHTHLIPFLMVTNLLNEHSEPPSLWLERRPPPTPPYIMAGSIWELAGGGKHDISVLDG